MLPGARPRAQCMSVHGRRGCVRGYLYARYVRARYLLGGRRARVLAGAIALLLLGGVHESARVRGGASVAALPSTNTTLSRGPGPAAEHDRPAPQVVHPLLEKPALHAAPACATAVSLRCFSDDCQRLYNCPGAVSPQYLCAQAYPLRRGPRRSSAWSHTAS